MSPFCNDVSMFYLAWRSVFLSLPTEAERTLDLELLAALARGTLNTDWSLDFSLFDGLGDEAGLLIDAGGFEVMKLDVSE